MPPVFLPDLGLNRHPARCVVGFFERGIEIGVCPAIDQEHAAARFVGLVGGAPMDRLAMVDQRVAGLEGSAEHIGLGMFGHLLQPH